MPDDSIRWTIQNYLGSFAFVPNDSKYKNTTNNDVYLFINDHELPRPLGVVQELSVVKAVVVGAVALSVVGRGENRHLVSVNSVVSEEVLHLVCHLK